MKEIHMQIEANHKKLADDMWDAIVKQVPFDKWIPIVRDKELAVSIICMFIDFGCYGESFELKLNSSMDAFMKYSTEWKSSKTKKQSKHANDRGSSCSIKVTDFGNGEYPNPI